jgi:hypothetical protein
MERSWRRWCVEKGYEEEKYKKEGRNLCEREN